MSNALKQAKTRLFANASITRWDAGERDMEPIVQSYNQSASDSELILVQIIAKRQDIPISMTN
ncbi:hypothetical protein [Paenibacillus sp. GCM10027626]|uniref:hypothetical protein n=1 Tax=Paenibacillus sp. GCM10027626 TaxID=3273411 RepID=UPI003643F2FD